MSDTQSADNQGTTQKALKISEYNPSLAGKAKKGPISCAECRRLKVRCDLPKLKNGPCTSCERRGCGELCPDNSLKTGKGTRYILSGTEELHGQIDSLRSRVKELEEALATSHASHSTSVHELLTPESSESSKLRPTAAISRLDQDDNRLHTEFDALMISDTGKMQWLGTTALSEWFVKPDPISVPRRPHADSSVAGSFSGDAVVFTADIMTLEQANQHRETILASIPDMITFDRLVNIYYEQVAWFYNPIPRQRLNQISVSLFTGSQHKVSNHELSSIMTTLAFGSLMDISRPPDNPEVTRYANLGRLALSLDCVFAQTSVDTVEAVLMRCVFLLFDRDPTGPMKVYAQLGLLWRMVVSIGMHRDPSRWNFDEEECLRRRRLFWEFVSIDTWQYTNGLASWGRPSSINLQSCDCRLPWDTDAKLGGEEPRFQKWKFTFVKEILLPILENSTTCGRSATLGAIMKMDKKIREYPLFDMATGPKADATQPAQAIVYQRNVMFCIKESALSQLHRAFFVSALNENLQDPLRSKFAASVLAVHASSCALLGRADTVLNFQPQTPRFFVWWAQSFSAMVNLGALVVKAPSSALAASAVTEIHLAVKALQRAKDGFRARRLLPAALKLQERVDAVFGAFQAGKQHQANDSMDVLPGIVNKPIVVRNAIFPVSTASCMLTGTYAITSSTETSTPSQQQYESQSFSEPNNQMDMMVDSYLHALQAELDQLAMARAAGGTMETEEVARDIINISFSNSLLKQQTYMPPNASLLPSAPPFTSEPQLTASYDPVLWGDFMAQLGWSSPS
ncbi:hypothetical protein CPB86DRAFT_805078 [Serendipita vermifera]|nr:hypothetical protein CPB86DRAFT_805078 [Serendipita vermifera]